ncbi:MAG: thermonuclease family protein [Rhodospirillales bacterium]|nr:thermonuclease family protein [Rhodospirillales bacterium]
MIRAVAVSLCLLCGAIGASAFWGTVTSACETPVHRGVADAIDGHTLHFTRDNGLVDIIRLVSVEAPELCQVCRIDGVEWDCGLEARSTLAALVDERELACCMYCDDEPDGECMALRRDDDTAIGEEMLRAGMATSHAYFANNLQAAESQANNAGRGLWRGDRVHPDAWCDGKRLGAGPCRCCYLPE